jgi:NADH-quinone oxidoreductase subunit M
MKLTLYLFIGSVVSLVGVLAMYWLQYKNTGVLSFDMLLMENAGFSQTFQNIWFLPVFLGFAVLGGIWPFHNWSPDGHVAAPTAVSMFHAGVLMKLGAFAALRVGIMLLPQGAQTWSWLIMLFAPLPWFMGIHCLRPDDQIWWLLVCFTHMGLVMLGFSTLNRGLLGSNVQMFSHGVMTALFFAVVGMISTVPPREIPELGGINKVMPFAAIGFIIGGLFRWVCRASRDLSPSSRSSWAYGARNGWWRLLPAFPSSSLRPTSCGTSDRSSLRRCLRNSKVT